MAVNSEKVYGFLNQFIDSKLLPSNCSVSDALAKDQPIEISGNNFMLNCWVESTDKGNLVCVELSRKKMIFLSEAYSLGVLFSRGDKKKLNQEDLWNMGFS